MQQIGTKRALFSPLASPPPSIRRRISESTFVPVERPAITTTTMQPVGFFGIPLMPSPVYSIPTVVPATALPTVVPPIAVQQPPAPQEVIVLSPQQPQLLRPQQPLQRPQGPIPSTTTPSVGADQPPQRRTVQQEQHLLSHEQVRRLTRQAFDESNLTLEDPQWTTCPLIAWNGRLIRHCLRLPVQPIRRIQDMIQDSMTSMISLSMQQQQTAFPAMTGTAVLLPRVQPVPIYIDVPCTVDYCTSNDRDENAMDILSMDRINRALYQLLFLRYHGDVLSELTVRELICMIDAISRFHHPRQDDPTDWRIIVPVLMDSLRVRCLYQHLGPPIAGNLRDILRQTLRLRSLSANAILQRIEQHVDTPFLECIYTILTVVLRYGSYLIHYGRDWNASRHRDYITKIMTYILYGMHRRQNYPPDAVPPFVFCILLILAVHANAEEARQQQSLLSPSSQQPTTTTTTTQSTDMDRTGSDNILTPTAILDSFIALFAQEYLLSDADRIYAGTQLIEAYFAFRALARERPDLVPTNLCPSNVCIITADHLRRPYHAAAAAAASEREVALLLSSMELQQPLLASRQTEASILTPSPQEPIMTAQPSYTVSTLSESMYDEEEEEEPEMIIFEGTEEEHLARMAAQRLSREQVTTSESSSAATLASSPVIQESFQCPPPVIPSIQHIQSIMRPAMISSSTANSLNTPSMMEPATSSPSSTLQSRSSPPMSIIPTTTATTQTTTSPVTSRLNPEETLSPHAPINLATHTNREQLLRNQWQRWRIVLTNLHIWAQNKFAMDVSAFVDRAFSRLLPFHILPLLRMRIRWLPGNIQSSIWIDQGFLQSTRITQPLYGTVSGSGTSRIILGARNAARSICIGQIQAIYLFDVDESRRVLAALRLGVPAVTEHYQNISYLVLDRNRLLREVQTASPTQRREIVRWMRS